MIEAAQLPLWVALLTAMFLLVGAAFALIGSFGLLRLANFYERAHAPTLGNTFGTACILAASVLCFSVQQSRPMLHEVLIAIFAFVTTPVTLMVLVRAVLFRDRLEGRNGMPRPEVPSRTAGPPG
ncbi:MAG: cation:proton antiporter [Proteobacteria bacterium]|nr:cation:proton antiporter [Pseudomonadota bacterium]